jgi:shikimate dehydrogenase
MTISGSARLAGIIGDPVTHSLSPRLHSHWLKLYGIDGAYVPLPTTKSSFSTVLCGIRAAGFSGVNVTVPHKEAAFALADRLDVAALAARAVNLLVFHGDEIEGRNTDAGGLAASLRETLPKNALQKKVAVILGAGGAARAAVLATDQLGAGEIRIVARDVARAGALSRDIAPAIKAQLKVSAWTDWKSAASHADLLINATSAGMHGRPALALPLDVLPPSAAVCDIVYNPLDTPLLADARARGHAVIDGLGMLMHQAVPAFEAFYGVTPMVTTALRQELEGALRGRQ